MGDTAQPLVVIGLGGFGRELATLVASGRTEPRWSLTAILDDDAARHGERYAGAEVTGAAAAAREVDASVVVAVGNPRDREARRRLVERLGLPATRYTSVVASDAHLGPGCSVGPGSVCMPHVVCTTDVRIGAHTNVMPNCTLTHDVTIGDYVAMGSGAQLAGGAHVGDGAYIGAGALVREGVRIGAGALVGMGAVVVRDVPAGEVWAGTPARRLG